VGKDWGGKRKKKTTTEYHEKIKRKQPMIPAERKKPFMKEETTRAGVAIRGGKRAFVGENSEEGCPG